MKTPLLLAALIAAAALTACNRQSTDMPPTSAGTASAPATGASR
jgi:hypothetical protein